MSRIRSTNTKPEIKLRKILFRRGFRGYRIHYHLTGKPDIVFVSKRLVIFIDGCFWHHCPKCFIEPATRRSFWSDKIKKNVRRDKMVNKTLRQLGWKIIRFWEHEVKDNPEKCLIVIMAELKKNKSR